MTLLVVLAVAAQAPMLFGWTIPLRPTGESAVNADIVLPALADAAALEDGMVDAKCRQASAHDKA